MKAIGTTLQAHLDSGATTMAYCWKVTRTDGVIQGFTEHDLDLTFGGVTYEASSGFTATQMEASLGLAVDNLNVDGALSSDTINDNDVASGLYDNAEIELYWVNWADTTQSVLLSKGAVGEVQRMLTAFTAELRSQSDRMGQNTGRAYQRFCDAKLGDSRCTIDLTNSIYHGSGTVTSLQNPRIIVASGLTAFTNDWFSLGIITFTGGANDGLTMDVKIHSYDGTTVTVELWQRPSYAIVGGDTFTIIVGCRKDNGTCISKFNNIINFQGFPFIPGNDILTAYPIQGGANQSGGSIFADPGGVGDLPAD